MYVPEIYTGQGRGFNHTLKQNEKADTISNSCSQVGLYNRLVYSQCREFTALVFGKPFQIYQ